MATPNPYPLEDLRTFFVRRTWLANERGEPVISQDEYQSLKDRRPTKMTARRVGELRMFVSGWQRSKS